MILGSSEIEHLSGDVRVSNVRFFGDRMYSPLSNPSSYFLLWLVSYELSKIKLIRFKVVQDVIIQALFNPFSILFIFWILLRSDFIHFILEIIHHHTILLDRAIHILESKYQKGFNKILFVQRRNHFYPLSLLNSSSTISITCHQPKCCFMSNPRNSRNIITSTHNTS